MHDWETWQWILYYAANLTTGAAYMYIPWKMQRRISTGRNNRVLFQSFVLMCGIHHLAHPLLMQFDWFAPLMVIEICLATISILCARFLKFDPPGGV